MKRVLVVGGAGYIGGWLTDKLIEAGYETRVYDLLLYEERFLKDVDFIAGDVLDQERLRPHLDWAEAVVWLAALVGDPACALNPGVTQKINVDTIDWLCRTFEGRIVFPSTCSVYGANDQEVDESSATDPFSLYAQGKLEAESVIMAKRPDSLIFRLATIAGVGDSYSRIRMDLVVNLLVMRAKAGRTAPSLRWRAIPTDSPCPRRGDGDRAADRRTSLGHIQPRCGERHHRRHRRAGRGTRGRR